jgi:hypothetical protein
MKIDRHRCGLKPALSGSEAGRMIFYEGIPWSRRFRLSPQTNVPQAPRSNGWRCRVIKAATAKEGFFAIALNDVDAIGVIVSVELERGAAELQVLPGQAEKDHGR